MFYLNLDQFHCIVGQNSIWNIFGACGVVHELFRPTVHVRPVVQLLIEFSSKWDMSLRQSYWILEIEVISYGGMSD